MGGVQRHRQQAAVGDDGDGAPLSDQLHGQVKGILAEGSFPAPGIAHGHRTGFQQHGTFQRRTELGVIGGRKKLHPGNGAQERHVERPLMRLAVGSHQSGPVHGKHHMVAADGHIVKDLVIGPLQKGGIDGAYREHPPGRQAGGHGHRVFLGDAHVKKAFGIGLCKGVQPGPRGHGGGHRANFFILCRQTAHGLSENRGKIRLVGVHRLSGDGVKGGNAVEVAGRLLRGQIALALHGLQVDDHGLLQLFRLLQQGADGVDIVAVRRAQVFKPHQFKQGLLQNSGAQRALADRDPPDQAAAAGDPVQKGFGPFLHAEVARLDADGRQALSHRAHVGADGHIVVVEYHDQGQARLPGVIHGLIGHAAGKGAVTDDADSGAFPARQLFGPRHTQRHRHRGGSVSRNGAVAGALRGTQKAADAVQLPEGAEAALAPGEHLVHIALVSHIEDEVIPWDGKHPVDGHGQLHRSQIGGQMSPCFRHTFDEKFPDLGAQAGELLGGQPFQVRRTVDMFQPGVLPHVRRPPIKCPVIFPAGPDIRPASAGIRDR